MPPLKHLFTLVLVSLLFAACTTLEIGVERTPRSPLPTPTVKKSQVGTAVPTATSHERLTITSSPTPASDPRAYVGIPQEGTLYLGNPQQNLTLFLRKSSDSSADPNLGSIWYLDKSFMQFESVWYLASGSVPSEPVFDFRKFPRPYPVASVSKIGQVYDVKRGRIYDPDRGGGRGFAYVSFDSDDSACPLSNRVNDQATPCPVKGINRLLEIDLVTAAARDIWLHDLSSDTYPEFHGAALIDQVAGPIEKDGDRYLVLRLLPCSACEAYPPHAMLLLNARTGQELYLGKVGNVNVDFIGKVVSYQNLETLQVECAPIPPGPDYAPTPLCEAAGYVTHYVPTSELLKQPLP